ncbi:MAG: hypothetical protein LH606_10810 [Cytophagaceae bacterium]|nr:hypothetical protein [Cytophagaceae bacterium]
MGFYPPYNPDAIKNVDLYKGGFPARYGGRAAAVLDLTMKEGNNQKASQELSVGVLASRFLAEGPIGKGRTSYLIAARQMNTGLIFLPQNIKLWTGGTVSNLTNLWFYDLNAKINHTFSDKSQLLFSAYHNNDFFKTAEQNPSNKSITSLNWGNLTSTLRYNRALAPRLFGKVTLGYSRFNYRMSSETSTKITDDVITNSFTVRNTIQDWFVKAGLEYTPSPSYTLRVGGEQFWHRYYPGRVTVVESSHPEFDQPNASTPIYTQESAAYLENDFQAGSAFRLNLGLRMAKLAVNGKTYPSMEPRLSMALALSPRHTLKLGVSRMRQFMHQLTSNGVGIPNDIWVPATERVPPVLAQQLDAGLYWQLGGKGDWHLSLEGYRKQLLGLIDYPQGTDLVSDFKKNWQDLVITNVAGRVYGLEGMVQKKVGNLNGWLSYTYSVSRRQSFGINQGKWYPARYDRPHSLAAVLNYKITPNWSVSTNFIYQSGFPVTLPVATVVGFNGEPTPVYTDRNNGRMPNYHRLDVGATYRFTTRRNREASWNFGVYNLYGRNNPYYLEPEAIKRQVDTPAGKPLVWQYDRIQINKRAGLPILPYVSYQIKF